jgi:hypothetical protein
LLLLAYGCSCIERAHGFATSMLFNAIRENPRNP